MFLNNWIAMYPTGSPHAKAFIQLLHTIENPPNTNYYLDLSTGEIGALNSENDRLYYDKDFENILKALIGKVQTVYQQVQSVSSQDEKDALMKLIPLKRESLMRRIDAYIKSYSWGLNLIWYLSYVEKIKSYRNQLNDQLTQVAEKVATLPIVPVVTSSEQPQVISTLPAAKPPPPPPPPPPKGTSKKYASTRPQTEPKAKKMPGVDKPPLVTQAALNGIRLRSSTRSENKPAVTEPPTLPFQAVRLKRKSPRRHGDTSTQTAPDASDTQLPILKRKRINSFTKPKQESIIPFGPSFLKKTGFVRK